MGLMKKIFGRGANGTTAADESPQSDESDKAADHSKARDTRRELVQVVLRDTMRKHGIPSDWIDCRILSAQTRQRKAGMHVQFVVRQGDEQLLNYVHAFQDSFWEEILKFEPQAREWLFSVAWQFCGKVARSSAPPPVPHARTDAPAGQEPEAGDTQPQYEDAEDLESDLQALYAIRDAAISQPAGHRGAPSGSRVKRRDDRTCHAGLDPACHRERAAKARIAARSRSRHRRLARAPAHTLDRPASATAVAARAAWRLVPAGKA